MTATPPTTGDLSVPTGLRAHWATWLGASPDQVARLGRPADGPGEAPAVVVLGSSLRTRPGWDGTVHAVVGVGDPAGRVLVSVPPEVAPRAGDLVASGGDLDALAGALPGWLGRPEDLVYRATCRWSTEPAAADDLPDAGRWLPAEHPRVPPWLRPFGGEVLVAEDEDGSHLAGVGLKHHDEHAHEIAVGTEPAARGRGLARRLVAQAARHLLATGVVATYLHDPANLASARVASAAGFPDRGWTAMGLADASEQAAAAGSA